MAFQAFSGMSLLFIPLIWMKKASEQIFEAKLKELADQGRNPKFIYVIPNL